MTENTKDDPKNTSIRQVTGNEFIASQKFPWLLRQKITIPERVVGYVYRAELVRNVMPLRRKVTLLKASGGFGKTTLLADCCTRLSKDGVPVAWISLDERDDPEVLDIYIAFACHGAGLDLFNVPELDTASHLLENRTGLVVHEIQRTGKPFVIAIDELERLRNPASVSLLQFLVQCGPSNLHLAFACREIPDGFNVAGAVLEGQAEVFTQNELRFSKSEVAKFFELSLSRKELASEMRNSAGWPLALQISRNRKAQGTAGDTVVLQDFTKNWIESRLFFSIAPEDRDFLLDIGLFEWVDTALLDEVLQRNDTKQLLDSMRVLDGLLEPVKGGDAEIWRLHPLVKEYCCKQRYTETPQRFLTINRRIAEALLRRGETVPAMRHAIESGDPALAGEILEQAGGVRLWTRQGLTQIQAADRYLTEDVISTHPRLALVRCLMLLMTSRFGEARIIFHEVANTSQTGQENEHETDFDFYVDKCIVHGAVALYGAERFSSDWIRTLCRDCEWLLESRRLDSFTHGHMEYAMCVLQQYRADFEAALKRLAGAQPLFSQSRYLVMHGEVLRGQVAMAQGHVQDAEAHYHTALKIARKGFALDPMFPALTRIMLQELSLECNMISSTDEQDNIPSGLTKAGVPLSVFAAASGTVIERGLRDGHISQTIATVDKLLLYARNGGLKALARFLAAMRTSVLVIAGRVEDAERNWREEDLPESSKECVDLFNQSWREMEAVACARLRLLIARQKFQEGRILAKALIMVAVERRLRRTQMRVLVLTMVLEHHAGELESAMEHLGEFFGLYAQSPYALQLMLDRATCTKVVTKFIDLKADSPYQDTGRLLLSSMNRLDIAPELILSEREREVLLQLEFCRDKQIASRLGLTVYGLRYHLRKLFRKLDVNTRAEAVQRARQLGLIPD